MAVSVEELQIEINAKAQDANTAIDRLVGKLDRLSASLGRLNTSNLNTLAMGVNRLGTAMQTMNGVKTADFTRLAKNLERLNLIDVSNLSSISASVNHMATAFNQLGNVSENALSIGEMAKNIAKLGNKSVQTAITNIPQLAVAMRDLLTTLSTAPNVSRNIIDMTNALANLANQGSRVGSASRSIVRGMNNTTSSMNRARKSTTSLAAAFGKFYATWFLVIRGAKQFVNAIEGTADYIEAYNYYNVALGKIASDWGQDWEKYGYANAEAYADSFTDRLNKSLSKLSGLQIDESQQLLTETGLKNLGLNIQEITQYASQLASITNSIGQTGEVSLAAASAFTKLAGDISSLFNVDYSSVSGNLQSALIGQSRAVYKYGIDITNATLQTYAYNLGLEKAVSEMTQAEKMQLRMVAILDQSKVSWGDLANTINSPSNMLRQFSNNVKEAGMVLGQLFIPVLQKVLPVVNGVVIAIKRLLVSIAQLLGVKLDLDSFGQGYTDLSDGFDDMSDSLDGVASSAKKAKAGLRAFDELKVINMPETSGGAGGVGGGAIDLTDEILKATSEYEKVWQEAYDRMANKAQEIADRISKTLEPVRKIFEDFAVGDFFQAGEDTSHLVASILDFFAKAIDKVNWYGIGQKIGDFLEGIDWTAVLSAAGRLIWEGLKAAFELFVGMFDAAPLETAVISLVAMPKLLKAITASKIYNGIKKLAKGFQLATKAFSGNQTALLAIKTSFPKLGKVVDVLGDSFQRLMFGIHYGDIFGGLNSAITNIRNNLTGMQKGIIGVVSVFAEFRLLKDGFYDIASGADNLVESIGKIAAGAGLASAALYTAFGPAGLAIAGITAVVSAISGINKAFDEIRVAEIGESIKNALSNPGGTPLGEITLQFADAIGKIGESFTSITEKSAGLKQADEHIKDTWLEIERIETAMDAGVISVEDGTEELTRLFGELAQTASEKFTALENTLLTAFGENGVLTNVFQRLGISTENLGTTIVQLNDKVQKRIEELTSLLSQTDPSNPNYVAYKEELAGLMAQTDELTKSVSDYDFALKNIDYSELILDDGTLNTSALQKFLTELKNATETANTDIENAVNSTRETLEQEKTLAESVGDWVAAEEIQTKIDALPQALELLKGDVALKATELTDTVQNDFIGNLGNVIEDAQNEWGEKGFWGQTWNGIFGAGTEDEFVKEAVDKQVENIQLLSSSIETELGNLAVDSPAWAKDAMDALYTSLFDTEYHRSEIGGGKTVYSLNEDFKDLINGATNGIAELAAERGKDATDGYANGFSNSENLQNAQNSAKTFTEKVLDTIAETQDSHSPSKVTESLGKDAVDGYNLGISNNTSKTVSAVSNYMQSVIGRFSSFQSSFVSIGQQIMSGLINGMSSMETSLYQKAQGIADNITKTVQDALDIHSPSRVMFALGDYTMQGFKLGMENLYQPIYSSMQKFGKDLQLAPVPTIESMYSGIGYNQVSSYNAPAYEPLSNVAGTYNQSNAETNALLRELLAAVKQGQKIEVNGRELGRTVRNEANDYFKRTGTPYFTF